MQALVFSWSRHWCFARWRHCFFAGENLRAAQKNRKTLMRGRDGQAKGSCRRFHSRMRGCATDSSRPVRGGARAPPPAGASVRPGRAARPRHAGAERERVDRQRLTEPGVRQSSGARLLRGTDGNTVQRTAPPTAPPPLTTTRTGWHWSSSSSRQGREEESRRFCESCDGPASAEKLEAPGNGRAGGAR